MKINNKIIFGFTIILLVIVVAWKINKDIDTNKNTIRNEYNVSKQNELNTDKMNISNTLQNTSNNEQILNTSNEEKNENILNKEVSQTENNKVIDVTNSRFEETVIKSNKIVIVDFYATWCGPCTYMSPILEDIVDEREDIIIAKVDVDEEEELANKYNITRIPTMLIFKDGQIKKELIGIMSKETILQYIDNINKGE